jgi:glycosyltransferase involved in cell wall biosynthesis
MVVNEAMASGLPILGCTGVQAVEEMVVDGEAGWTFAPQDREKARQCIRALLAASPETLHRLGGSARQRALEISDRYTAQAMAEGVTKALCA